MPHKFYDWYMGADCLAAAGLWVTMFPCIAARIVCVSHVNISKYLSLLVIPPVGSQSTRTISCDSQKIWALCFVDCGGPAIDRPLLSVLLHQFVWGQCGHAFFISNPCGSVESWPTKACFTLSYQRLCMYLPLWHWILFAVWLLHIVLPDAGA